MTFGDPGPGGRRRWCCGARGRRSGTWNRRRRPLSVDALDDAEVALDAVGEGDQRLLVGLALVCRDGLFKAVELDQDRTLGDSGLVCDDPTVAGEGPPATGP